jgi:hypothetical protein
VGIHFILGQPVIPVGTDEVSNLHFLDEAAALCMELLTDLPCWRGLQRSPARSNSASKARTVPGKCHFILDLKKCNWGLSEWLKCYSTCLASTRPSSNLSPTKKKVQLGCSSLHLSVFCTPRVQLPSANCSKILTGKFQK